MIQLESIFMIILLLFLLKSPFILKKNNYFKVSFVSETLKDNIYEKLTCFYLYFYACANRKYTKLISKHISLSVSFFFSTF